MDPPVRFLLRSEDRKSGMHFFISVHDAAMELRADFDITEFIDVHDPDGLKKAFEYVKSRVNNGAA